MSSKVPGKSYRAVSCHYPTKKNNEGLKVEEPYQSDEDEVIAKKNSQFMKII